AFAGIALAPVIAGEPPADFDAGSEVGFELWNDKAHEADKGRHARHFDRPQTESVPLEVHGNSFGGGIAFRAIKDVGKELHHTRIGIERGERSKVRRDPRAEKQASGF